MAKIKRKIAVSKKAVVKHKAGLLEIPVETVKSILADLGYSGKILMKATNNVFGEVKKLAAAGVVSAADLEKAVVKGVQRTNDEVVNASKKIVKKVLK